MNGRTANLPAFAYLAISLSDVPGGKLAACVNRNPENTSKSPANETEPPSTAFMMSLDESTSVLYYAELLRQFEALRRTSLLAQNYAENNVSFSEYAKSIGVKLCAILGPCFQIRTPGRSFGCPDDLESNLQVCEIDG
jgi:hypothetical protein